MASFCCCYFFFSFRAGTGSEVRWQEASGVRMCTEMTYAHAQSSRTITFLFFSSLLVVHGVRER